MAFPLDPNQPRQQSGLFGVAARIATIRSYRYQQHPQLVDQAGYQQLVQMWFTPDPLNRWPVTALPAWPRV